MAHTFRRLAAVTVPLLAAAAFAVPAASAGTSPALTVNHSASTHVSAHPDSGAHGNNWANDNFTRLASLHFVAEVALSHCGGSTSTGHCYQFSGSVTDNGTFTTDAGVLAPGFGYENGGGDITLAEAITGKFAGKASYGFFSSWKTAGLKPPPSVSGPVSGETTTGLWLEQFFASSARFWDSTGAANPSSLLTSNWGWTYTAPPGADAACPNVSSQWVDSNPDGGAQSADGNVLAPDAAHC